VTSSLAAFEAEIWGTSKHLIKSGLKTRKRIEYEIKRYFYINLHLNDRLDRIHSLQRRADASGSAEIIYRI